MTSAPSGTDQTPRIERVESAGRYEIYLGDTRVGLADYVERDGVVVLPHTETSPAHQGQGLAAQLVRFALDDIRSRGLTVVPACSYVAMFVQRHPEYADLVAS